MNLWEIDVNEFLRCGIDPNIGLFADTISDFEVREFETISDTAADSLATIVVNKLDGMAKQLHTLADQQKRIGRRPTAAFKNPVHQVLECHALHSPVLLNFYKTRVVQPCQTIAEKYISSQKSEHWK